MWEAFENDKGRIMEEDRREKPEEKRTFFAV